MDDTVSAGRSSRPEPLATGWRRTFSRRTLAFAAVYVIWGSTYLGIRMGVDSIPPFLLAGARSLLAGSALFVWLAARGARWPNAIEWRRAAVAGILMLAGGNGLVTVAEQHVPSNLAALLIAGTPAYVVLLDWWRPGGVRPSRRAVFGVVLGSLGLVLLVRPGGSDLAPGHWYGVAALLVAGWCWAAGSVYSRYHAQHPDTVVAGAQQMIVGGAVMLLVALGRGELGRFAFEHVSTTAFAAFAYLTVFGSLVAFSAFNWLIPRTTPAQLATSAYVNPVVALVLGWLVLEEALHPVSLAGAAAIVGAVIIMLARSK
jgi:drug/metabolite transporter (DMT)-like permease